MEKIIEMVDFPYEVIKKKKEFFDYILYCCNKEKDICFRLKVSPVVYDRIKINEQYYLPNEPVFQKCNLEGKAVGGTFMRLSNF